MDMGKQSFDVGIGGLNLADSLLFRHLRIPYVKISPEDIETSTMVARLGMPVVTSTYPSATLWSQFKEGTIPDNFGNLFEYRGWNFIDYKLNQFKYW